MGFKTIYKKAFLVCYVFIISTSVFPSLLGNLSSVHKSNHSEWTNKFFSPLVCFLLFNASDTCGRLIADTFDGRTKTPLLSWLIYIRTLFIPLFMLCNFQPR